VLAHCVNPNCRVALQSFSEGRLYQFEVVSISVAANDDTTLPFDEKPKRQTTHFWLCGACSSTLSVTLEPLKGLQLVPLGAVNSDSPETRSCVAKERSAGQPNHC
jgi:hypothetical protein